jgi:hypothetical protein
MSHSFLFIKKKRRKICCKRYGGREHELLRTCLFHHVINLNHNKKKIILEINMWRLREVVGKKSKKLKIHQTENQIRHGMKK